MSSCHSLGHVDFHKHLQAEHATARGRCRFGRTPGCFHRTGDKFSLVSIATAPPSYTSLFHGEVTQLVLNGRSGISNRSNAPAKARVQTGSREEMHQIKTLWAPPARTEAMLEKGFVLAMSANLAVSDYSKPFAIHTRTREWLVVSRWGGEGEYLSISTAGERAENSQTAPGGLKPHNTLLGLLVSDSSDEPTSTFLLVRQPPQLVQLAGIFFPADGYAQLQGPAGRLRLRARARYSHSRGWANGREILKDVPDPAPAAPEAMAWHIDAERRSWIGDLIA
jgi:hypothetical protein